MSLSDRIAVMFDGQIMGERRPAETNERELGADDGRDCRWRGQGPHPRRGGRAMTKLPTWADVVLVPLISLLLAAVISGLVILAIGEDPVNAARVMVTGALGSPYGWGYTLYYTTSFIFTGLAVTVAYHAGQFNIGGEGQAQIGGLGVALVCLALPWPHWTLALPAAMIGAALFGAAWAAVPAYLQAPPRQPYRDHHDHVQLYRGGADHLSAGGRAETRGPDGPGDGALSGRREPANLQGYSDPELGLHLEHARECDLLRGGRGLCRGLGSALAHAALAIRSAPLANPNPRRSMRGFRPFRMIMVSMLISGGLAGLMAINNVMGEAERLLQNSAEGAGFIGIAVALMGRNHPFGVFLAALLFGFLYQGGAEMGLWTQIPIELRLLVQGLVILFTGALDTMVRMMLVVFFRTRVKGAA